MAKGKSSHTQASAPMLDRDYQAEDDHRTLSRAQEIAGDHQRMSGVRKHHAKMTKSLQKVGSLLGHRGGGKGR